MQVRVELWENVNAWQLMEVRQYSISQRVTFHSFAVRIQKADNAEHHPEGSHYSYEFIHS